MIDELTALVLSDMTRDEMVQTLTERHGIPVPWARLIIDIARGDIDSDVIISGGGKDELTPVLPL